MFTVIHALFTIAELYITFKKYTCVFVNINRTTHEFIVIINA